jgi:hypothetical protein
MVQFDNAIERYNKIILSEMKEANIKCWLAGGAIRDYFMGVPIKTDYDMFFPNEDEFKKAEKFFKSNSAEVKWESDNGMKVLYNGKKYDLIKKYWSDPQATIEAFDFTVSMFAVDSERVYHGETSFIDLSKRQLMLNKIPFPASTMSRAFRYYQKGFSMCMGEMKKLVEAIQDMPKPEPQEENDTNSTEPSSGEMGAFFTGID